MRKIIIISLSVLFLIFLAIFANAGQRSSRSNVLVVGMETTFAPFNWTETRRSENTNDIFSNHRINGSISIFGRGQFAQGYDVWISRHIAEQLGYELVIERLPWGGLITALQLGHIDLIIAGMTPTPRRQEVISFSNEYHEVRNVMVVHQNSPFASATSIEDLEGARIVGQLGTLLDDLAGNLASQIPGATHSTPLDNIPAILSNIRQGGNDITILSETVALSVMASDDSDFVVLDFEEDPLELPYEWQRRLGIGIRQDDNRLEDINNILDNMYYHFLDEEYWIKNEYGLVDKLESSRKVRREWMSKSIALTAGI